MIGWNKQDQIWYYELMAVICWNSENQYQKPFKSQTAGMSGHKLGHKLGMEVKPSADDKCPIVVFFEEYVNY